MFTLQSRGQRSITATDVDSTAEQHKISTPVCTEDEENRGEVVASGVSGGPVDPYGIGKSDTDTVDGQSDHDPDAVEDVEISPEVITSVPVPPGRVSLGMSSLDEVQLDTIFERRAHVMRSILHLLEGPYRAAVRLALREATVGRTSGDMLRLTRAWKLFLLLPRMWLSRPPRGGLVPKGRLLERVSLIHNGHWSELVERSVLDSESAHFVACRKRRRSKSGIEQRAARALRCVLDGELSGLTEVDPSTTVISVDGVGAFDSVSRAAML